MFRQLNIWHVVKQQPRFSSFQKLNIKIYQYYQIELVNTATFTQNTRMARKGRDVTICKGLFI